jgi:hypothetical protein
MSYPKKTLKVRPTRGLALDLPANEVGPDYYTGGRNISFRNGFAERIGGRRECYTQNNVNPVYHLLNVRAPGGITESNFWLVFGTASLKALETSNISDIEGTALTGVSSPWQWSSTLLNNIPCFTNGLDAPRYWAGDVGTPSAELPGWPAGTICKSLIAFKFHLFALDIDGPSGHFESQFLWSDAAAPGDVPSTWTAAATNEAGDGIAADTPGPCMCGVPLQDTLLMFKRSSTYAINYLEGNPRIFSIRLLDGDRGALTRHGAIDVGGKAFVVSDGDVFLTDGVNWQSPAQGRIRDYLFTQLDQASYENLFVMHDRARGEVWICYPTTGNTYCNEAIVYEVASDAFSIRDLASVTCGDVGVVNDTAPDESWNADSQAWDADNSAWNSANFSLAVERLVTGANSADLFLENDETAVAVDATLYRHDLSLGAPERMKFARRLHVRTNETPGTLYCRVGSRNSVTDAITWDTERALTPPAAFVNVRSLGRFLSVEIRGQDTDVWRVSGFDIEAELRGYVTNV